MEGDGIVVIVAIAALFLMYKSCNLSDTGVYKSITMDFTPSHHRGKWNIIHSIIQGFQNLFTMLGGFLADELGVMGLFWVVAVLNFVALIPLLQI